MARFALLLLLVGALLGAGCGGDDSDDDGDTGAATAPAETQTGGDEPDGEGDSRGGGSDEDEDTAEHAAPTEVEPGEVDPNLSRREYIRRADRICNQLRQDIAARSAEAAEGFDEDDGPDAVRRLSAELVGMRTKLTRASLDRLKAEPRPPDRRKHLGEYFRRAERQVELLAREAEAVRENRPGSSAELTSEVARNVVALQKAARRFGFELCGVG